MQCNAKGNNIWSKSNQDPGFNSMTQVFFLSQNSMCQTTNIINDQPLYPFLMHFFYESKMKWCECAKCIKAKQQQQQNALFVLLECHIKLTQIKLHYDEVERRKKKMMWQKHHSLQMEKNQNKYYTLLSFIR